jgi:hypothetical protein
MNENANDANESRRRWFSFGELDSARENQHQSSPGADFGEQFAVSHIKGEPSVGRDIEAAAQDALREGAAARVLQFLCDTTEAIDKTGYARVRRANHRSACLDAAKDRIFQMLLRTRRLQEPSIVCHIGEEICAT